MLIEYFHHTHGTGAGKIQQSIERLYKGAVEFDILIMGTHKGTSHAKAGVAHTLYLTCGTHGLTYTGFPLATKIALTDTCNEINNLHLQAVADIFILFNLIVACQYDWFILCIELFLYESEHL